MERLQLLAITPLEEKLDALAGLVRPPISLALLSVVHLRVRLKIIGNLETMHDSDLPTLLVIISSPIIFKRTVVAAALTSISFRIP